MFILLLAYVISSVCQLYNREHDDDESIIVKITGLYGYESTPAITDLAVFSWVSIAAWFTFLIELLGYRQQSDTSPHEICQQTTRLARE